MADENNQDMAMEDILSSIKNILEEEQSVVPSAAAEEMQKPRLEDDDILDLSPNMRLPEVVDENPEDGIDLDAELDEIQLPELGSETIELPVVEEDEPRGVNLGWEDFESDPFYEEPQESRAEEAFDEVRAEMQESEETFVPEMVEPVAEPEVEPEPDLTPDEIVFEPELVQEPKSEPVQEPSTDDAVDVSASIINNFAKMFAKEEAAPMAAAVQPIAAEVVHVLGDGSKTIEEVVASVIRQIIGDEVAADWKQGVNYDVLARQEVYRQTKEWLDNNLPAVVEKIVKQEIERVMAKVGSNQ